MTPARCCSVCPLARTTISVYALSSFLATFAGIVLSLSKRSGDSTIAVGAELDVIAAVVIGGTLLTGGVGYVIGTFIGCHAARGYSNLSDRWMDH